LFLSWISGSWIEFLLMKIWSVKKTVSSKDVYNYQTSSYLKQWIRVLEKERFKMKQDDLGRKLDDLDES